MSVRIYQLSKQLHMENKELIALLQKRGYEVASASSTISNIDAEALLEEMKPKADDESTQAASSDAQETPEAKSPGPQKPEGKFVKTAEEVKNDASTQAATVKPPPKPAPVKAAPPSTPPPVTPPKAPQTPPQPTLKTPPAIGQPSSVPPSQPKEEVQETAEDSTAAPDNDIKVISLKTPIVVRDFAGEIGIKPFRLISELMEMGIFASMNQAIEENIASKVAENHGFLLEVRHRGESQPEPAKQKEKKPEPKEPEYFEPRPPVVCVLGHVDHGKTTVLDTIRKANVVAGEAGGITQHIGAYQVEQSGQKITFIDTPGHAAFSKMRERGANITDIAILVVAADDGFMPQTDEALKFAQKANVPVVVAINKMDAKGANIDRVKQQMQQRNIASEDWGGETLTASISALKNENMDGLLETITLQSEILELKGNPKCGPQGVIIEAQMEVGRGPTATVIMEKGTLKVGDVLVCGTVYCKVRAMMDDKGGKLKSAPPATPLRILGWSGVPDAGDTFHSVKNERIAKAEAQENLEKQKRSGVADNTDKATDLDMLMQAIAENQQKTFHVVIKGDVHGSVEALAACLEAIESDKIKLEVVNSDVGQVSKNDVIMASAAEATIIGFNVKMDNGVSSLAKHHNIRIIQHNIIYELIDQVKEAMSELLEPELQENKLGAAEVRQVFPVAKGFVAGCMITEGRFLRDEYARIYRKGETVYEGRVGTLKRFKEDTQEARAGYECGISIQGFNDYKEGDVLESYEIQKIQPKL